METKAYTHSNTRSVVFCGLSIALLAVSAWISIPFGPVPFTLQTFVLVFILLALRPSEALASIAIYIGMGALGLPVFSAMRGGFGVILGPTGGFLWGFLLGAALALGLLKLSGHAQVKDRCLSWDIIAALVFLFASYTCGWLQLAAVSGMGLEAAFAAGVAPFILIDAVKLFFAIMVARAVRNAV